MMKKKTYHPIVQKQKLKPIQIQILIFVGMYLFLQKFKKFFINFLPKSYTYQLASRNAHNQFYNLKQDKTKQTIMFFVSFDEKYVEKSQRNSKQRKR